MKRDKLILTDQQSSKLLLTSFSVVNRLKSPKKYTTLLNSYNLKSYLNWVTLLVRGLLLKKKQTQLGPNPVRLSLIHPVFILYSSSFEQKASYRLVGFPITVRDANSFNFKVKPYLGVNFELLLQRYFSRPKWELPRRRLKRFFFIKKRRRRRWEQGFTNRQKLRNKKLNYILSILRNLLRASSSSTPKFFSTSSAAFNKRKRYFRRTKRNKRKRLRRRSPDMRSHRLLIRRRSVLRHSFISLFWRKRRKLRLKLSRRLRLRARRRPSRRRRIRKRIRRRRSWIARRYKSVRYTRVRPSRKKFILRKLKVYRRLRWERRGKFKRLPVKLRRVRKAKRFRMLRFRRLRKIFKPTRVAGSKPRRWRRRFRFKRWKKKRIPSLKTRKLRFNRYRKLHRSRKFRRYLSYRRKSYQGLRNSSVKTYLKRLVGSQSTHTAKLNSGPSVDWSQVRSLYTRLLYLVKKNRKTAKIRLKVSLPRIKSTRVKPYLFLNFSGRGSSHFRKPVRSLKVSVRTLGKLARPRKTSYKSIRKPFRYRGVRRPNRLRLHLRRRLKMLYSSVRPPSYRKRGYKMPSQTVAPLFTQNWANNTKLHKSYGARRSIYRGAAVRPKFQTSAIRRGRFVLAGYPKLPKSYRSRYARRARRRRLRKRRKTLIAVRVKRLAVKAQLPINLSSSRPNQLKFNFFGSQIRGKLMRDAYTSFRKKSNRYLYSRMYLRSRKHRSFVFKSVGMFLVFQSILTSRATVLMSTFRNKLLVRQYSFIYKSEDKRRIINQRKRQVLTRILFRSSKIRPSNPWVSYTSAAHNLIKKTMLNTSSKLSRNALFDKLTTYNSKSSSSLWGVINGSGSLPTVLSEDIHRSGGFGSTYDYVNRDPRIRRIRFKPGYQRIWRHARSALLEIFCLKFQYQKRLTKHLVGQAGYSTPYRVNSLDATLERTLIFSRLVHNLPTSQSMIRDSFIFINTRMAQDAGLLVAPNDFIQVIVSLRYYLTFRWFTNWTILRLRRIRRLVYRKNRPKKYKASNLRKQISRYTPNWVYKMRYDDFDTKPYLEVDYLTLSFFVLTEPHLISYYRSDDLPDLPIHHAIYRMYNWKYIN